MDQFLGEIRMFAGDYAPEGWLLCAGQLLPIGEYEALFTLLGAAYGGDGQTTFAVPDLRGRVPIHLSEQHAAGETGGQETVSLTTNQLPAHQHAMQISIEGNSSSDPAGRLVAPTASGKDLYSDAPATGEFSQNAVEAVGGARGHDNMMPFQVLNFIIASTGIYPSPN